MADKELIVTPEMIEEWKKKHGDIYVVEVEGHEIYMRMVRRAEMGAATTAAKGNPARFTEILLKKVWLHGDQKAVFSDEALLNAVAGRLDELIPMAESELKKL